MAYLKKATFSVLSSLTLAVTFMTLPDRAAADADPYVGEIAPMGLFGFCPRGWASAEGQLLAVNQHDALFSLLGTMFGGDGRTTFGLPDLRGRIPMGDGNGPGLTPRRVGQRGGIEQTTLIEQQLASHNHAVNANNLDGDKPGPGNKLLAAAPPSGTGTETIYSNQPYTVQMSSQMIGYTGGNVSVDILDPALVIRYCIALVGVYPSRN
jgi:microcystin-dependent protein